MSITVYNKKLTTKAGEVYEVGKYITIGSYRIKDRKGEWRSENQYYIRLFTVSMIGYDCAGINIQGRLKGSTSDMGLVGPQLKNLVDKIIIHRVDAEELRRWSGKGKKNRYVMGSDGYIWLPDFMLFDHPATVLQWVADPSYTAYKELHDAPPDPPCFPDWIPEEHGFEVIGPVWEPAGVRVSI